MVTGVKLNPMINLAAPCIEPVSKSQFITIPLFRVKIRLVQGTDIHFSSFTWYALLSAHPNHQLLFLLIFFIIQSARVGSLSVGHQAKAYACTPPLPPHSPLPRHAPTARRWGHDTPLTRDNEDYWNDTSLHHVIPSSRISIKREIEKNRARRKREQRKRRTDKKPKESKNNKPWDRGHYQLICFGF